MKAVFDANILIDYLNGIEQAKDEINRYSHILISSITWMEVLVGATKDNEAITRAFLSRFEQIPVSFEQIPVSSEIAEKAVMVRKESKIRLPDAIIKATADCENALLISRNTKDFLEDDPSVRVPYRL